MNSEYEAYRNELCKEYKIVIERMVIESMICDHNDSWTIGGLWDNNFDIYEAQDIDLDKFTDDMCIIFNGGTYQYKGNLWVLDHKQNRKGYYACVAYRVS